jgi:hypothetical protein
LEIPNFDCEICDDTKNGGDTPYEILGVQLNDDGSFLCDGRSFGGVASSANLYDATHSAAN